MVSRKEKFAFAAICLFIVLIVCFSVVLSYEPTCQCGSYFRPEYVESVLNGREHLRWAQVKINATEFQTDDEIDREIVYGKTGGGWNVDVFSSEYSSYECGWLTGSPNQKGGEYMCKSGDTHKLIRTKATLKSPATWNYRGIESDP